MKKEKEQFVEKDPFLKQIEKQEKGIVKIEFNEEVAPIQSIKEPKKPRHKPQESQIPQEKAPIPTELPEIAQDEEKHQEIDIEQLEREIKAKKKLLKLKKEEEKRKIEEEEQKQKIAELEEEKKQLEESQKQEEIAKKEEIQQVRLIPDNIEFLKTCPACHSKIWRSKVRRQGIILSQMFRCKNKACNFQKEISLRI
jgi:hypothetical protein